MLGGYIGNCLEKWVIDEDLCGMVRRMMAPLDIRLDTVDTGIIDRAGIGGNYLMQPETLKHCRTAFFPYTFYSKEDRSSQSGQGLSSVVKKASEKPTQRMRSYEKPEIDPTLETDLAKFVLNRKQENLP